MKTSVDIYIWKVQKYMMTHYGCDNAIREIDPLIWYIQTGRASGQTIRALLEKKPYMIGRLLHKGGSHDECIARIKEYIQ